MGTMHLTASLQQGSPAMFGAAQGTLGAMRLLVSHARALLDHIPEPLVKFDDDRVRALTWQVIC